MSMYPDNISPAPEGDQPVSAPLSVPESEPVFVAPESQPVPEVPVAAPIAEPIVEPIAVPAPQPQPSYAAPVPPQPQYAAPVAPAPQPQPSYATPPQPQYAPAGTPGYVRDDDLGPAKGKSIASMVLGILSLVLSCLGVGFILAIIGLILGIKAEKETPVGVKNPMATAGKICSIIGLVPSILSIIYWVIIIIGLAAASWPGYYYNF
jgi:hypothetical protein